VSDPLLDRDAVLAALGRLAEILDRDRVRADIYVFGGAAMTIAFQARRPTADVDAIFEPQEHVFRAAQQVAKEQGLPQSWLNDQAASFVPRGEDLGAASISATGSVRIMRASMRHLLTMKVLAGRGRRDADDVRLLMRELGLTTKGEILNIVREVMPDELLTDRAQLTLDAVLGPDSQVGPDPQTRLTNS